MSTNLLYKVKLLLPSSIKDRLSRILPKSFIYFLKKSDYIIISFPKCGRSWLKLIICDFVYFQNPNKRRIDDVSTEILYKVSNKIPRIIFSHDHNPMYRTVEELNMDKSEYQYANIIFLVRDPRDVIVSWFFEYKYRVSAESKKQDMNEDSIALFMRNKRGGLATIVAFYNIWMQEKNSVNNFMLLKYENLLNQPLKALDQLNSFLNIKSHIEKQALLKAIDNNNFDRVKKRELEGKIINGKDKANEFGAGRGQALKARRGVIGGYKDYFSQEDIEWANAYIKEHLNKSFNY